MRLKASFLVLALLMAPALAAPALAQAPAPAPSDAAACQAEQAALERDMDLARAKGQMLRRRQLAETLAALRMRCETRTPAQVHAARVEALEQEIRTLRLELDRAEAELRDLRAGGV